MNRRIPLVVAGVLLVQEAVVPQIRILGSFPDVIPGFVAAAALAGGATTGSVVGFAAGLGEDLFLQEPFGMSALVYTVMGFLVGTVAEGTALSESRLAGSSVVASASAAAVAGYALLGALLGQTQMLTVGFGRAVGIVTAVNLVLGTALIRTARWAVPAAEARATPAGAAPR